MKNIKSKKINFFQKIFIKIARLFGFEIINQDSGFIPSSNKYLNDNLSKQGKYSITVPLGSVKITRPVKSLNVIFKTCTSVNLVTQNKKRIFEKKKSEYTFRALISLVKSINFSKKKINGIKYKIFLIDSNSSKEDVKKMNDILISSNIDYEIINLNLTEFENKISVLNKDNKTIENNMRSTMASIYKSFLLAKEICEDVIYFVEDDYIHSIECITEMLFAYEKFTSIYQRELFLCPVDYPYLYKSDNYTKVLLGHKKHWRKVNETLLTFLTSRDMIIKHWKSLIKMASQENMPYEAELHKIYEEENCFSPIPSLAMHCTNINSAFGLSPNINWEELWDENKNNESL